MATRKRIKVPHPLLAPWVRAETGRMTELVNRCPATWAAVSSVIWYGARPKPRLARAIARTTGFTVEQITEASAQAYEQRRELEAAA
jgi:hypothetical protein